MLVVTLPDPSWVADLEDLEGVELRVDALQGSGDGREDVQVVVPPYLGGFDTSQLAGMPRLRLVQLLTAGYETVVDAVPDGVLLANAAGVHDASTAELAMTLTLASLRQIPEFVLAQQDGRWDPDPFRPALADSRVLILGYGSIGRALAARLLPFEVTLTAVASRPRAGDDLVPTVHGLTDLERLLPDQDVVVVLVPLNDSTRHLVDGAFLARMRDGALLVNVARGGVVDTDAMLQHAGRLAFALDVTDPEPLPPDHPLWHAPRVLISPHTGGASEAFHPRAAKLLRAQLERLAAGEQPANIVNDQPRRPHG